MSRVPGRRMQIVGSIVPIFTDAYSKIKFPEE